MSVKGGKPWRFGGRWAPEKSPLASKGRKLVCDERLVGTLREWHGTYGFIVPQQKVTHPHFRGDRIFVRSSDMQEGSEPGEGSKVDFFLYCDDKGLGAGDCREVQGGAGGDGSALPDGWEKMWSAEHGQFYYWNAQSKEAVWDLPGVQDTPDDGESPLPEGWEKHYDPENKAFYFWHRPTKTTTWERPTTEAEEEEPAPEANGENEEEDDDEARAAAQQKARDAPVLAQQRLTGHITHWQGSFGWIAPEGELPEDLEPLVADQQNRVLLNWRALPDGLTPKVGLHLDFYCSADETGIVATDVTEHDVNAGKRPAQPSAPWRKRRRQPVDPMVQLEKQWAKQDALLNVEMDNQAEETADLPALSGAAAEEETEGVLLPGWEQKWSDEHQCHYYWHAEAKMSCWERPAVPMDDAPEDQQAQDDDPSQDKIWPGEGTEAGAARLATPITPVVGRGAGREMTPITPAAGLHKLPQQPSAPPPPSAYQSNAIGKSAPTKGGKGGSPQGGRAGKGPSQWPDGGAQTGSGALPSARGGIGAAAWVRQDPVAPVATIGARPGFDRLIPRWQPAAKRPRL